MDPSDPSRYPPFSLGAKPDYPATLDIAYPERLSSGLVLVKWWLLALPQYAVVAVFTGGGAYTVTAANGATLRAGTLSAAASTRAEPAGPRPR